MVELAINIVAFVICGLAAIFVTSAGLWVIAVPFRLLFWLSKRLNPKQPSRS